MKRNSVFPKNQCAAAMGFFFLLTGIHLNCTSKKVGLSDWQGEWGSYDKTSKGSSLSLSECSEETPTYPQHCKFHFENRGPDRLCKTPLEGIVEVRFPPGEKGSVGSAEVELTSGEHPCVLRLSMKMGRNPSIETKMSGEACSSFCPGYSGQTYPLQSKAHYLPSKLLLCYTDSRKSVKALCEQGPLQDLSTQLKNFSEEPVESEEAWFQQTLSQCETHQSPSDCLKASYSERLRALEKKYGEEPELAKKLIAEISGQYEYTFKNSSVDGEEFDSENILTLTPKNDLWVDVDIHLEFYNGHECNLSGPAMLRKGKKLILINDIMEKMRETCTLTIGFNDESFTLSSKDCNKFFCGERGSFSDHIFKRKSMNSDKSK